MHYLGLGRVARRIGIPRALYPSISSIRPPRTPLDSSLIKAMSIISRRRINATLIGADFASYLPELNQKSAIGRLAFLGVR